MARGGKRDGAGRKINGVNKVSAKARAAAAATGEMPHEFLLRVSRGGAIDSHPVTFSERMAAAQAAAPYYAPKLASTEVSGPDGGPVQIDRIERVIIDGAAEDAEDTDTAGVSAASTAG